VSILTRSLSLKNALNNYKYVKIFPGEENLDIQILEEEDLPDIDETDMIHGLDHTGRFSSIHRFTGEL
jgi:hypothetical protein